VDVWGAILVLVRRFYITVPLAAISIVGGYLLTHKTLPEYHAQASIILLPPTAQPATQTNAPPPPVNTYVTLGTGTLAAAVEIDLSSTKTLNQIVSAGNTTNFSVSGVDKTSILEIDVTASSAQQAISTAGQVVALMQADIVARQTPYTTKTAEQITAQVVGAPQLQGVDTNARTRAEAIAIGAALVVTILSVLIIDAVLASRARNRRRSRLGPNPLDDEASREQQRTTVVRS